MDLKAPVIIAVTFGILAGIAVSYKRRQLSKLNEVQKEKVIIDNFKSTVKTGLYAGIGFLFLCALICGFMCFRLYKEDGDFVFRDVTVNLNDAIKNENEPEAGTYVTANFSLVGEAFYSDDNSTMFYPVVLNDSGEKPCVIAIRRDIDGTNVIESLNYVDESVNYINSGKDTGNLSEIEVSGRYVVISHNLSAYENANDNSKIDYQKYNIKNTCVDITVSKEKLKHDIVVLFIAFIVFVVMGTAMVITTIILSKHF